MTGKINNYFNGNPEAIDAIKFGTESDYNMDFPEKLVMEELQSGAVGGGRFTASKFKIESIESMASVDWESNIIITTDVNDDGIITTNPKIVEENMKDHIDLLFLTKEITHQITNALSVIDMDQVQNIVGSLAVKAAIMALSIALPAFPLIISVVADVGVMLAAVLNAMRVSLVK